MYCSRLPQFGSSHQFESLKQKLPMPVAKDWPELIFSKDQRINHFFPLCFLHETQETRLISLVITWWNHVASCTAANLDARNFVVFWVNFSGISALFYNSRSLYIRKSHGIVWYYLFSLALTRSNSQHRSVLSRLLSSRGLLFRELPRHIFDC